MSCYESYFIWKFGIAPFLTNSEKHRPLSQYGKVIIITQIKELYILLSFDTDPPCFDTTSKAAYEPQFSVLPQFLNKTYKVSKSKQVDNQMELAA